MGVVVRSNTGPSYMPLGTACRSAICSQRNTLAFNNLGSALGCIYVWVNSVCSGGQQDIIMIMKALSRKGELV